MQCIYLDHNATTPVDPRVLEAMLPFLREHFGNASSKNHPYGWKANEAVEAARAHVARLLGASPKEIIFTSGATEANNLALLGLFAHAPNPGGKTPGKNHLVTQATEHHAILDTALELGKRGVEVTVIRPDAHGRVSPEQVKKALTERTLLASIMAANNEVGTLSPLAEIGAILKQAGVLFHTDAAQAVGKVSLDVEGMGIDLLSLSAHKFYGPKGVGALYVRSRNPRVSISPLQHGGGQERGIRPGTLNVPGIVGLGEACRVAQAELSTEAGRLRTLRERLHQGIASRLPGVKLNGHPEERLPGTLNLSFEGVEGASLIVSLPELAVSSGSACTTGSVEPSYVLKAMGVPDRLAVSTIRFSLGRYTTEEEVDTAVARVAQAVLKLRGQLAAVEARP
jgi:cysteine desulfurase